LNAQLDGLYRTALEKRPDSDRFDIRKGKAQLIKAEDAWQKYRTEHCKFVGGLQGGSNLWVSYFGTK
jgi:uncharacterized protein YecT (DUF1311 family)